MSISKEQIDKVIESATQNHLLDLTNQFTNAINSIPGEKNNPVAREIIAANIAQNNVMNALKEICYELLISKD